MKRKSSILSKTSILVFYISVAILLNFIIPPFQNPDEPQHFGAVLIRSLGKEKKGLIENEIISIMDKNSWWRFAGMGKPEVLPENFSKMESLTFTDFGETFENIIFYHYLLSKMVSIFKGSIIFNYYLCRLISIFFVLCSFLLIYLSFRSIFRTTTYYFAGVILSILFLPQFVINSVSVNPDSLSVLLSSVFFFAFISLIIKKNKMLYFALLILAAGAGFLTDKSSFFLIAMLILTPFFWIRKRKTKNDLGLAWIFLLSLLLPISWIVWYFPSQFYNSLNILKASAFANFSGVTKLFCINDFNKRFFIFLADSLFLKFGWMAYAANKTFYYILRIFIVPSFAGVIIYFSKYSYFKAKKLKNVAADYLLFKIVLFSIIAICIQILGIWVLWGARNILPQGRYLFPVVIPIVLLFWMGIKNFFSIFRKDGGKLAVCILVIAEFFFLNYTIWNYIIPIFHLTLKAPHPGI